MQGNCDATPNINRKDTKNNRKNERMYVGLYPIGTSRIEFFGQIDFPCVGEERVRSFPQEHFRSAARPREPETVGDKRYYRQPSIYAIDPQFTGTENTINSILLKFALFML